MYLVTSLAFFLIQLAAIVSATNCPSANDLITAGRVKAVGSPMILPILVQGPSVTRFYYQEDTSPTAFTATRDLRSKKTEIYTSGNTGRSFFFGVVYNGNTRHAALYKDPNNDRCDIPFVAGAVPTGYTVTEVTFI